MLNVTFELVRSNEQRILIVVDLQTSKTMVVDNPNDIANFFENLDIDQPSKLCDGRQIQTQIESHFSEYFS